MKKRERILIIMEILSVLRDGPKGPTRLAQAVGLSFDAFIIYANEIEARKFVSKSVSEGRETYSISPQGSELLRDWQKVWNKLSPDSS